MEFLLLGTPMVRCAEQRIGFRGHPQRAVFAALALHSNQVVAVDRLVDVVWPERPPRTAQAQIHKAVSALRVLLTEQLGGGERIETIFPGYLLRAEPGDVDAEVFHEDLRVAAAAAAAGHPAEAAGRMRCALARWSGPALEGVPGLAAEATYLEEKRLTTVEECAETELALGGSAELVAELEKLVVRHPLRERLRALHMLTLYRCGRRAEALQAYRSARRLLHDELGLEPGPDLRRIEHAILTDTPAADLSKALR